MTFSTGAFAQEDWENDGEIENVEVVIEKDLEIKLPTASRNFEKIPPQNLVRQQEELQYFFSNIKPNVPALDLNIRPLKIKNEPLDKTYGNYVKAGFGSYTTPYVEAFLNNKRNDLYSYGAHLNYLRSKNGPVDDENSGSGVLALDLYGKLFGNKATLFGDLNYSRNMYHFYGYDEGAEVDEEDIKQIYNTINVEAGIENTTNKSPFSYRLLGGYKYFVDDYDAREGQARVELKSRYDLSDGTDIQINADFYYINREDSALASLDRTLFRFQPKVRFEVSGFEVIAGFNAVYEDDSLGTSDKLHFYPLAEVGYYINEGFRAFAGISGNMEKQTLASLVRQNPYLNPNQRAFHSNKTFEFYGGIEGKVDKVGFGAGISAANYKNMFFFINDSTEQSRFNVIYDTGNTGAFNLYGELSYADGNFKTSLRGDVFAYSTDNIEAAYHKPNYKLSFLNAYNLFDKFVFSADIYVLGGITAMDMENEEEITLDAAADLNFKTDYMISSQVSAFIQFNNILSQEYELLNRYPSRGFQFMGGLTYSF